jgi:hypothetical protein
MIPRYENLLTSSFLLWIDHNILQKGSGFVNTNSQFYPTKNTLNGVYTYAAPFNQFIADSSISGVNVITGIYVGSTFTGKGQGLLVDINYERGHIYLNSQTSQIISGYYAIKDFNISLANVPERKLLFETQFNLRPKVGQTMTGAQLDGLSYPCILVKNAGGSNQPFAFGGLDETYTNMSLFIYADSEFLIDSVISLTKDLYHSYVPFLTQNQMPFNISGGFKNNNYNYDSLVLNKIANSSGIFVKNIDINKFNNIDRSQSLNLNPDCFFATVDFELCYPRFHSL